MPLKIGTVVEGKVTGIVKFGAFVSLPEGKSGLIHISEIANSFVADIGEYLQVGQTVQVFVLNITDDGKINLSLKRAAAPAVPERREEKSPAREEAPAQTGVVAPRTNDRDFEDKLKKFLQESDSRIADNRLYADRPRRGKKH